MRVRRLSKLLFEPVLPRQVVRPTTKARRASIHAGSQAFTRQEDRLNTPHIDDHETKIEKDGRLASGGDAEPRRNYYEPKTTKAAHRGAVIELVNALSAQTSNHIWFRSGIIVWRLNPETSSRAVELRCYSEVAFRLASLSENYSSGQIPQQFLVPRIPQKFLNSEGRFPSCYPFELSFAVEEVPEVAKGFCNS